jgi:hypothetical protein
MSKFIIFFSVALLVGCNADEKLVGQWKRSEQGGGKNGVAHIFIQTCTYSKNNTNTCENELLTDAYNIKGAVKYVTTQEWHIKKGILTQKNIDSRIREITANGNRILPSQSAHQTIEQNTLGHHPNGKTTSTKIEFKNNMFELTFDNGSKAQYFRVK